MKRPIFIILTVIVLIGTGLFFLSKKENPEKISYGVSFSQPYAEELGLDWRKAYKDLFEDLGVKNIRLSAYWTMIEPEKGRYEWDNLDFQVNEAEKNGANIILAIGRRLPRWPECHVPAWAENISWADQKKEILKQMEAVVERYKERKAILMWQVENEPYLYAFAEDNCGKLDEKFFEEELSLVRSLDSRPVLITDGGNFGAWVSSYRRADVFGTSVYVYLWNEITGPFRTILPPAYYRLKSNLVGLFGIRPIILSELSIEPWLPKPIIQTSIEEQLSVMDIKKFKEVVDFGRQTGFREQYLWGAEWWWWLKKNGHPEFWEEAKKIFL